MKLKKLFAGLLVVTMLAASLSFTAFADEEEIDYDVLGLLTENGYVNDYFDIQVELPSDFQLTSRAMVNLLDEDVVESSNKQETLDWLGSLLNLSSATVFEAQTDSDFITVTVESPGFMNDYWDEEEAVANNSIDALKEHLEGMDEEGVTITNVDAQVDYLEDFAGDKHSVIIYGYDVNDTPVYGITVMVRSDDKQYMMTVNIESFYAEDVEAICGMFTELDD